MPEEETFPLAEEGRLFYVALTRARRSVLILTVKNRESPFLRELLDDHHIVLEDSTGNATR
jgi:DNA helicase-4